jgi:hypothetical protein
LAPFFAVFLFHGRPPAQSRAMVVNDDIAADEYGSAAACCGRGIIDLFFAAFIAAMISDVAWQRCRSYDHDGEK